MKESLFKIIAVIGALFFIVSCDFNKDSNDSQTVIDNPNNPSDPDNPSNPDNPSDPNNPDSPDKPNDNKDNEQDFMQISYPKFTGGKVYLNMDLFSSSDGKKAEYIEFNSATEGTIVHYENGKKTGNENNTTFNYSSETGILLLSGKDKTKTESRYLFADSKGQIYGSKVYLHRKNGEGLLTEWTNGIISIIFNSDNTYLLTNLSAEENSILQSASGEWVNENGIIRIQITQTNEKEEFFYTSDGKLYPGSETYLLYAVANEGKEPEVIIENGNVYANVKYPQFANGDIYGFSSSSIEGDECDYYSFSSDSGGKLYIFDKPGSMWDYKKSTSFSYSQSEGELEATTYSEKHMLLETYDKSKYIVYNPLKKNSSGLYGRYTISQDIFEVPGYIELNEDGTITGDNQYGNITGKFTNSNGILSLTIFSSIMDGTEHVSFAKAIYTKKGLFIAKCELTKCSSIGEELNICIDNITYNTSKTKIIKAEGDGSNGYTILDSVIEIEPEAFKNKNNLKSIKLPANVQIIGDEAFYGCTSLETVDFSDSLKSIGYEAFAFTALSNITLPKTIESIDASAFRKIPALEEISVQSGGDVYYSENGVLYSIGKPYVGDIKSVIGSVNNKFLGNINSFGNSHYRRNSNQYALDYEVSGNPDYEVSENETFVFLELYPPAKKDTSFTIPSNVSFVTGGAFNQYFVNENSENGYDHIYFLTKLIIPSTVKGFLYNAFPFSESYTYNNYISEIHYEGTFDQLMNIYVAFADWHTHFAEINSDRLYINGSCVESIILDSSFKLCNTFSGLRNVKTIKIDNTWNKDDSYNSLDYIYPSLENITVQVGNEKYYSENGVLYEKNDDNTLVRYPPAKGNTSFKIPSSVKKIGSVAFFNCVLLQTVEIPDSVESIESSAFERCSALKNINLPKNLKIISRYTFMNCKNLEKITIPKSVIYIYHYAFCGCSSLKNVIFEDNTSVWENSNGWIEYYDTWWTSFYGDYIFSNPEQNAKYLVDDYLYSWRIKKNAEPAQTDTESSDESVDNPISIPSDPIYPDSN